MNKKLLLILISSILTLALLIFFMVVSWEVFVGEEVSLPVAKDTEKTSQSNYENSPFGLQMGITPETLSEHLTEAEKLGAVWVRLSGPSGLIWGMVEKSPGNYDWKNNDAVIKEAYDSGVNILVTVLIDNSALGIEYGYAPSDMEPYKDFLSAAVERYDADGIDDAPGSPRVDAWQIGNEVDGMHWNDTAENYAEMLKASYESIKAADPQARVAIAGIIGPEGISFYSDILENLNNDIYFDIFDFHWHCSNGGNYLNHNTRGDRTENFENYLNSIKSILSNNGYSNTKIWITEMSASNNNLTGENEKSQAVDMLKRYVYPAANGVGAVFWGTVYDKCWKNDCNNYFSKIGLIDINSNKKLSYYSYKLMTENLEGSDWDNIQTIQESDNVYVYKFMKKDSGEPVWVLWWDYFDDTGTSKTISLDVGSIGSVKITEAVPDAESGADLDENNYLDFFKTETKTVSNGKIEIILGESPVFVEEK